MSELSNSIVLFLFTAVMLGDAKLATEFADEMLGKSTKYLSGKQHPNKVHKMLFLAKIRRNFLTADD